MEDYKQRLLRAIKDDLNSQYKNSGLEGLYITKASEDEDTLNLSGPVSLASIAEAIMVFGLRETYKEIIGLQAPSYLTLAQLKEEIELAAAQHKKAEYKQAISPLTDRLLSAEALLAEAIETDPKIGDINFVKRVTTFLEIGGFNAEEAQNSTS